MSQSGYNGYKGILLEQNKEPLLSRGIRQLEITSGARVYTIPLSESGADTLQEDTAEEEVLTFPLILLPEDLPVIWVLDETSLTVQMDTENLACIL